MLAMCLYFVTYSIQVVGTEFAVSSMTWSAQPPAQRRETAKRQAPWRTSHYA